MSTSSLHQKIPSQLSTDTHMRWFFVIVLTIWTIGSLVVPIIIFCMTKSLVSFSFFSFLAPPAILWYRLAKVLFPTPPMDERTFELKRAKIQSNIGIEKKIQANRSTQQKYT